MSRNVVYQHGAAVVVVPQQHVYGEARDIKPQERCACKICIFGAIFIALGIFIIFLVKVRSNMFQFLGTRRETAYIMSLTGIILGIFLMVGALSLLFDIEKRQQRRVNQRMRQAMLMNDDLSAFERPELSSEDDDDDDITATSGMHKRFQVIPSGTASPAGRLAAYSQTNPAMAVSVDLHPKYPSRNINIHSDITAPYQSGSRGLPQPHPHHPLGAYSISGEISPYRPFAGGVSREYLHHQGLSDGQIISCPAFPASCSDDSLGHPVDGGTEPEAPPAYESQPGLSVRPGTTGRPEFLPQYQQPPPYTPYRDDPPPYSP